MKNPIQVGRILRFAQNDNFNWIKKARLAFSMVGLFAFSVEIIASASQRGQHPTNLLNRNNDACPGKKDVPANHQSLPAPSQILAILQYF